MNEHPIAKVARAVAWPFRKVGRFFNGIADAIEMIGGGSA